MFVQHIQTNVSACCMPKRSPSAQGYITPCVLDTSWGPVVVGDRLRMTHSNTRFDVPKWNSAVLRYLINTLLKRPEWIGRSFMLILDLH